jgi:hypothetical protein
MTRDPRGLHNPTSQKAPILLENDSALQRTLTLSLRLPAPSQPHVSHSAITCCQLPVTSRPGDSPQRRTQPLLTANGGRAPEPGHGAVPEPSHTLLQLTDPEKAWEPPLLSNSLRPVRGWTGLAMLLGGRIINTSNLSPRLPQPEGPPPGGEEGRRWRCGGVEGDGEAGG